LLAEVDRTLLAYVADEDDRAVRVIDVEAQTELASVPLAGAPAELVMLPDGRLLASLRDTNVVAQLQGTGTKDSPLVVARRIDTPVEPIGLALTPDDSTLLVASGWGHAVTAYSAERLTKVDQWDVPREPRTIVVSDDGKRAFVSHAVGTFLETIELGEGARKPKKVSMDGAAEVSGWEGEVSEEKRQACQGFALVKSVAPAGRIFAPHVLVFTGEPSVQSSGYGAAESIEPESFDVAVIDEDQAEVLPPSVVLHPVLRRPRACSLPRGAAAGENGSLYVTCLGENAVLELDGGAANPHDVELRRWSVPDGPTAIALHEASGRAFVWSQFAHTFTTLSLSTRLATASLSVPRVMARDPLVERGRKLFHAVGDRRISNDGRACASCHPDGRDDGLLWSSPDGPRQTPMLAGRLAGTAPYGWTGAGSDVPGHLAKTFGRLGGTGLKGEDRDALIAYVQSIPRPNDTAGLSNPELIARGEAIFRSPEAECASCHGGDGRSPDGERHDVKSRAKGDKSRAFDTPSLRFAGGTGPYFHDGRYATLRQLLVDSDGKMGATKHLGENDLVALEAFVRSR
jgi:DNA-binding beta-propeller fold protein YncE